jgi:ABC-type sugar transport system permease subunit
MESGFSAMAEVAATLFGLVMVSLVFAYNTAISRIDSIGDFSHFASWVWAAGFSCFIYFSCCFLISFRLMEDETWIPAIVGIVVANTILLFVSLYKELHWLSIMTLEDRSKFRGLYRTQAILPIIIFIFFQVTIWRAIMRLSIIAAINIMRLIQCIKKDSN